ncbi:VIT1/CCC1 transporter family protein [Georgenia sp. Z1344]|uniref:VIT1/CCC1 transporter family protein n=1 Tax=Georgenia sp. Z1344 TaxID=3416706 RepID=UPI003CF0B964
MTLFLDPAPSGTIRPKPDVPTSKGASPDAPSEHALAAASAHDERVGSSARLNQLRAGVLGANDGIVSVAGLVVGVAGASSSVTALAIAGVAALVAGALSMAAGEYVSVSTQRDTERSMIARIRSGLATDPERERLALMGSLEHTGVPAELSGQVADAMTAHDAVDAHLNVRLGMDEEQLVSPWQAAVASLVAFTLGGLVPLAAMLLTPVSLRVPATMLAVVVALALTGLVSSRLGEAAQGRATVRTIAGGLIAMLVTYGIGSLVGGAIG